MRKLILFCFSILFTFGSFSQTWTKTSTFTNPTNSHTLTVLGNGDVLQVGGDQGYDNYSNDVNIYNVESNTWTAVAPYPTNIEYHKAFATSETTVIVFGGDVNDVSTDAVYEYNSETDEWTPKASLPEALEEISATKLQDGRFLLTGGWKLPSRTINVNTYIYDATADTWTTVASLPEELTATGCVLLGNGDVVVAGGFNSSKKTSASSYVYNVENDTWTAAGNLPYPLSGIVATSLANGKAAIIGGFDFVTMGYYNKVLTFDASTLVWKELLTLDNTISNCVAIGFENNTLLVAGGSNDAAKNEPPTEDVTISMLKGINNTNSKAFLIESYIIDIETATITNEENLPEPRQAAVAAVLNDGRIIISGGSGAGGIMTDTYNDGLIYEKSLPTEEFVVSFNIIDNEGNGIEDAKVFFNEKTLLTNTAGQVKTTVSSEGGSFGYTVQKLNYKTVTVTSTDPEAIVISDKDIEKTVILNPSVGIKNKQALFELNIYPTISSGNITIVSPLNQTINIKILNQQGQIVETLNNVEGTKTVHLNLIEGVYIIMAENNMKALNVQKIKIQK